MSTSTDIVRRLLGTPGLSHLHVLGVTNGTVTIEGTLPNSNGGINLGVPVSKGEVVNLLSHAPQAWFVDSPSLITLVASGKVVVIENEVIDVLVYHEDFLNDQFTGNTQWTSTGLGANAATASLPTSSLLAEGTAGAGAGTTGTTATGAISHRQGISSVPIGRGRLAATLRARRSGSAASGTDDYIIRVGLGNATAANGIPTNGVVFLYDYLISNNWLLRLYLNGVLQSTVDTGVDVHTAAAWVKFDIQTSADGKTVYGFINDAQVGLITHDVVLDDATHRYGLFFQAVKRVGVAVRNVYWDYASLRKELIR